MDGGAVGFFFRPLSRISSKLRISRGTRQTIPAIGQLLVKASIATSKGERVGDGVEGGVEEMVGEGGGVNVGEMVGDGEDLGVGEVSGDLDWVGLPGEGEGSGVSVEGGMEGLGRGEGRGEIGVEDRASTDCITT